MEATIINTLRQLSGSIDEYVSGERWNLVVTDPDVVNDRFVLNLVLTICLGELQEMGIELLDESSIYDSHDAIMLVVALREKFDTVKFAEFVTPDKELQRNLHAVLDVDDDLAPDTRIHDVVDIVFETYSHSPGWEHLVQYQDQYVCTEDWVAHVTRILDNVQDDVSDATSDDIPLYVQAVIEHQKVKQVRGLALIDKIESELHEDERVYIETALRDWDADLPNWMDSKYVKYYLEDIDPHPAYCATVQLSNIANHYAASEHHLQGYLYGRREVTVPALVMIAIDHYRESESVERNVQRMRATCTAYKDTLTPDQETKLLEYITLY